MKLVSKFALATCMFAVSPTGGDFSHAVLQEPARETFLMISPEQLIEGGNAITRLQIYKKWKGIKTAIEQAGGKVEVINGSDPAGGLREVWVRDKYFMIGDNAYLPDRTRAQMMGDTYADEIDQVENFLRSRHIKTLRVKGAWFEGGNIIPHYASKTVFIGYRPGEKDNSPELLAAAINTHGSDKFTVVPVELQNFSNPDISRKQNGYYLYHLDTGMSEELPQGEILLSSDLSNSQTMEIIRQRVGEKNIIPLSREDSLNYAANLVIVENTIIPNKITYSLRKKLESRGYDVRPQSGFNFGGPHCNVNLLPASSP